MAVFSLPVHLYTRSGIFDVLAKMGTCSIPLNMPKNHKAAIDSTKVNRLIKYSSSVNIAFGIKNVAVKSSLEVWVQRPISKGFSLKT